jgi:hypothetical protein
MSTNPSFASVRTQLLLQHGGLRRLIADGRTHIASLQGGEGHAEARLATTLALLDRAFEEHNRSEEAALPSLLERADGTRPSRLDQLVGEHADEHRELGAMLRGDSPTLLLEAFASLEDHLDTEERLFLHARLA